MRWSRILRHIRLAAITGAVLALGCQQYQPMPLEPTAVNHRLAGPSDDELRTRVSTLHHPLLPATNPALDEGLTPDQAAIIAVLASPDLKGTQDERASAAATLLQAGLLPNPQLAYSSDFVTGGFTQGAFNAYGATLSWDVTALISHQAKVNAAIANARSVDLGVLWQEWLTAEAAKSAVLDLISQQAQLDVLREIDNRLQQNFQVVRKAADLRLKTSVDLAAAEEASRDARAAVLQARRDVEHQWLQLTRAMGLPPQRRPKLRAKLRLPSSFEVADEASLTDHLDTRRIDIIALRRGYDSQEQTLRAAVLDQFPKINFGVNGASDNSNVHSVGLVATIDLPVFDRNQGSIAVERATRQRLFDEFSARVFDARADIATAVADIHALNQQITDAQAAVPNLQRLVDAYRQALEHGNADVLSYYQAWNNLAQKRLGVLKLQQQLADTRIALEIAAGRNFSESPAATQPTRNLP